jgi:hypothetical protein
MLSLPVSRLVNVAVNLSPSAVPFANFNVLLLLGDTDVIDVNERIREYASIEEVATDFGSTDPEFLAAELYFSQIPQPSQLFIGRWAQAATHGMLKCGILSPTEQVLSAWTAVTTGSFDIVIDGAAADHISGLDFHLATNLDGVASVIQTALTGATCIWDGERFIFSSVATGVTSSIDFLAAEGSGVDISTQLKGRAANSAVVVDGIAAETALQCVTIMDNQATIGYGIMFVATAIVDADHVAVAGFIEAAATPHLYGVSSIDTAILDPGSTSDIASVLKAAGYNRSTVQYSQNPYAMASAFGRAFAVQFTANSSVITLMFKAEPGISPERLSTTAANALKTKRANVFTAYNNGANILQYGTMAGPLYFDEIHGLDWLKNAIQTNVFNLLYTTPTKIPQTDAGMHTIASGIEAACAQGVVNGFLAPGVWTAPGFGQIKQGDYLAKGYYVYTPPLALQAQADREARKSVAYTVGVKLAGAVHEVLITVNVNR